MDYDSSPAHSVLRPGSRRLLAFITVLIERDCGSSTIWHDQLAGVVGSKSIITPGLRELNALGFINQTRDIKRSTFTLSDGWRSITSKRAALLISANARLPPTHRKWKTPQPASTAAPA